MYRNIKVTYSTRTLYFFSFFFFTIPFILLEYSKYYNFYFNFDTFILLTSIVSSNISLYLILRSFFYSYKKSCIFTSIYKTYYFIRNNLEIFILIGVVGWCLRLGICLPLSKFILFDRGTLLYSILFVGNFYPYVYLFNLLIQVIQKKKVNFSIFSYNICLFYY